ncbi:aldo/keto reductase [Paraburkholderia kirstenboschensis]|uniref:aldo/keto reductase n=1 Tax=Paraburkholderia kirstenboschensis TaxID=1245436 RepID=UPI001F1B8625|nr:aldo/keto reductase [Paraburkholderia kirstenboschensis]
MLDLNQLGGASMEALKTERIELPRVGFGTFRMPRDGCPPVVESALELGYRHIDTAKMYQNEEAVGAAIAASDLARKQLHLTTKVWHENLEPESLHRALDASLGKLGVDFVNLYMVHWPSRDMDLGAVMETMQGFLQKGTVRSIGVCNLNVTMLRKAVEEIGAPIARHQIEYHRSSTSRKCWATCARKAFQSSPMPHLDNAGPRATLYYKESSSSMA